MNSDFICDSCLTILKFQKIQDNLFFSSSYCYKSTLMSPVAYVVERVAQ